jgi:hypothetical protein
VSDHVLHPAIGLSLHRRGVNNPGPKGNVTHPVLIQIQAAGAQSSSEVVFSQTGDLQQRAQKTSFQRSIAMNRNDNSLPSTSHRENVMTTVNPSQKPTALLKGA